MQLAPMPWVEAITDGRLESNYSIVENIPPEGMSFSDFICTFAMSCYDLYLL